MIFLKKSLSSTNFNLINKISNRKISNFRNIVNENKYESKKLFLIENLSTTTTTSASASASVTFKGNKNLLLTKSLLSQIFNVKIDNFWTWIYRRRNFILIKLNQLNDVERLQSNCGYNQHALPIRTRMLETNIFSSSDFVEKLMENKQKQQQNNDENHHHYEMFNNNNMKKTLNLSELRRKFTNEQLGTYLAEMNHLNDLDIHLRYFIISQLEEILCKSIFSDFQIYPFGSSLAGLGDSTSDLDLVLLHSNLNHDKKINFAMPELKSERDQTQQCLSLIADILRNFIPNFSKINRILRARIPIVKMSFDLAPIDIDISIELSAENAHHGFIMANYLNYCVSIDNNVKKFLIFIKYWCRQHGIVKSIAGNWFSNFQILTLCIFYLQTKGLLKPIKDVNFESSKLNDDEQQAESSLNINLTNLIYEFFEFLVSFDFEKNALSIYNGQTYSKPDFSPLYVENPIEKDLNVCKNVCGVEFKKFLLQAYNSLDAMHENNFHLVDLLDPEYFKLLLSKQQQDTTKS